MNELIINPAYLGRLRNQFDKCNIGLICSNTIVDGKISDFLPFLQCSVITHVRELDFWTNYRAGLQNLKFAKKHTTRYIAAPEAVKDNVAQNHKIPEESLDSVYEFSPTHSYNNENKSKSHEKFLKDSDIQNNAFIVGSSGTTDCCKGLANSADGNRAEKVQILH